MYQAKASGRGRSAWFRSELALAAHHKVSSESRLRRALAQGEMALYFQPQVSIRDGTVVGAEGLLRWLRPDGTVVPPGAFIPLAEETGLIGELGYWAIEQACSEFMAWRSAGLGLEGVSVNVSLRQLRDAHFESRLADITRRFHLPAGALELEITESMMASDPDSVLKMLRRIVATDVRIAIDDFGTGYSSLGYIRRMPVHTLKIDKCFLDGVPASRGDCEIVRTVVDLASRLELATVAEGVESVAQAAFLREIACPIGQGYLYGKPMERRAFLRFLAERANQGGETVALPRAV